MKFSVEKIEFWSGEIRDAIGGLAAGLKPVVDAGANFAFVIGRRMPDKPGAGHVFFGGLKGAKQAKAASAAGFVKADLPGLRVEASDKPGTVEAIVAKMAEAGINLRGVTASGAGVKCSVILAFDSTTDRDRAARLLRS
jgi:hypothetical protein